MTLTPLQPTGRRHYIASAQIFLIIQTFSNFKHALLYESHCPYSCGICSFLCSPSDLGSDWYLLVAREILPEYYGNRVELVVSTKEIYLLTLKAIGSSLGCRSTSAVPVWSLAILTLHLSLALLLRPTRTCGTRCKY
jgi:hypothetical protein